MAVKALLEKKAIKTNTTMAGREFLEKKTIRATITIEVPYDNELMNYGSKLDQELRKVIDRAKYLSCSLEAGNLEPSKEPVIR